MNYATRALRHHVTGAIERGEGVAIVGIHCLSPNAHLLALVLDAKRWPDTHAPLLDSHRS